MAGLGGRAQRQVALAVGLGGVAQQPQGVRQAQPDQQLRVLPVAQHVRPAVFGAEAVHGRFEMSTGLRQPPGPVGRDALQVAAFHPEHLVVIAFGPGAQLPGEAAGRTHSPRVSAAMASDQTSGGSGSRPSWPARRRAWAWAWVIRLDS